MSSSTANPAHASPVSWGIALAGVSLLVIGGGAIIWSQQSSGPPAPMPATSAGDPLALHMAIPVEILAGTPGERPKTLHHVTYAVENGTRVVKIRVVPDGDELIVDAATGRLLETRPSRPTAPPPMGKFAAPFSPMT